MPLYLGAVISLWFVARPYGSAKWRLASASALVAAGLAMLANQAISHVWERPGPSATHPALTHLLSTPSQDPFPSDRTAVAFAVAFALLAFSRRAGAGFLAAAMLIGLSLIAVGIHYPSDVLVGAVVGCAVANIAAEACAPWIRGLVALVGRVTDPVLAAVWDLLGRQLPVRRY